VTLLQFALLFAQAVVTPELRQHVEAGLKARAAGDLAAAHVNLGSVLFQKQAYGEAIPPLRRALTLNPELPGAQQMLGAALLAQGAAAEAVPHLERAKVNDLLGIALLESGKTRDAVDRLEAALLERPNDPDLLYYLSQAHGRLAKNLFDRLRAQPNGLTRTQQMLGEAAAAAGQREQAAKHLQAALAARPDLRGVHLALGELQVAAGDYAQAEREFRAESQLTPASPAAAYQLGNALLNLGRVKEALPELERSHRLRPDMPETALALGKAHAAMGDAAKAEAALQQVVKLEPASALAEAAHLQLAQLYRKLGRAADADRELQAFRKLRQQAGGVRK